MLNQTASMIESSNPVEKSSALHPAIEILLTGNFEERWAVCKFLVKYGETVINPLAEKLFDENTDGDGRWYILKVLSEFKHPQITLIISQLLQENIDDDLIILATEILAKQGKEALLPLLPLLNNCQYRLSVIKSLASVTYPEIISPLLNIINDDNPEVRRGALALLSGFNRPEITSALIHALGDYSGIVRQEAIIGLSRQARFADAEIPVKLIIPYLDDVDINVAQQACFSLSRFATPSATLALYTTLINDYTPIVLQKSLIQALAWQETANSIECLGKALWLVKESIISEIIASFGRINNQELSAQIAKITIKFYEDNYPRKDDILIWQNLCYTWQKLEIKESINQLKYMEKSAQNSVKFHAQSALKALL